MLSLQLRKKLATTLMGRITFVITPWFVVAVIKSSIALINRKTVDVSYFLNILSEFFFMLHIMCTVHVIGFIFQIVGFKLLSEEFISKKHNFSFTRSSELKQKTTTTLIERILFVMAPGLIIATIELLIDAVKGRSIDIFYFLFDFPARFFFVFRIMSFIHVVGFVFRIKKFRIFSEEFFSKRG